jgi:EAL domain-containing protein (putative c-di-GMP-specific phosphodiesterase class I)
VDTVKVDQSFVSRMGGTDGGVEMVRAIVALAHSLDMDVVAEGVETADQLGMLLALRCEYAQGFCFSRPVDAAAAGELIANQLWKATLAPALAGCDK